jgi:hypothetical protein
MKKVFFVKKAIGILVFVFAFIVGLSFAVMAIWNNVLVPVLHVIVIGFRQALGIIGLANILFGGFPGGRFGGRRPWNRHIENNLKEKWMHMSPEERERFKERWKGRCDRWSAPATGQQNAAE